MKTIDPHAFGAMPRRPTAWYRFLTRPVWVANGIVIGAQTFLL
jgi:hypothetical protein